MTPSPHHGKLITSLRQDSVGQVVDQHRYEYDAHGRQARVIDLLQRATIRTYDAADRVMTLTMPPAEEGDQPQTTLYLHDYAGRVVWTRFPDGATVTNWISPRGELLHKAGARVYPVSYNYDAQGRRKTMTTWTNYATLSGAATTSWTYDPARGWLVRKEYPDGTGVNYAYTPAGRLGSRAWARGLVTNYGRNAAGEVLSIRYSDPRFPGVDYSLDRVGRRIRIGDSVGLRELSYTEEGRLERERYLAGVLAGVDLGFPVDPLGRRKGVSVLAAGEQWDQSFGYDDASRLAEVAQGVYSASYAYIAGQPMPQKITYRAEGIDRMITEKVFDGLNRLRSIRSVIPGGEPVASFEYTYNDSNQRMTRRDVDGSSWSYGYDRLGQVTAARHTWADGEPVPGEHYEFAYDDIGNRLDSGVDLDRTPARRARYRANALNQLVEREVPGIVDVAGEADPQAQVTVNAEKGVVRKGRFFHKALAVDNSAAPVGGLVPVQVDGVETEQRSVALPRTPERFLYDLDGNLLRDGLWEYAWDAENHLIGMQSLPEAPGRRFRLEFLYDDQSRRVAKNSWLWQAGTWVPHARERYVYDGWNVIAILDANNRVVQSLAWGLDLSNSRQGAGGVGGLLLVTDRSGTHAFPGPQAVAYDGNGNIATLVDLASGTPTAFYEYAAFGDTIRFTGPLSKVNAFLFSTKYSDEETGLLFFGFRYHNPLTGGWLTRDPYGERNSPGLYVYCKNDPVNMIDPLGLTFTWSVTMLYMYYIDPNEMPLSRDGQRALGATGILGSGGQFGSPVEAPLWEHEPCSSACERVSCYDRTVSILMLFATSPEQALLPVTFQVPGSAGVTTSFILQTHEEYHGNLYKKFFESEKTLYEMIFDKCVPNSCFSAWSAYKDEMSKYLLYRMYAAQAGYDADQYYDQRAREEQVHWDAQADGLEDDVDFAYWQYETECN